MKHLQILVPGAPEVTDSLDITAPFDFSKLGSVVLAEEKTVEKALQNAFELYQDKNNWLSLAQRLTILEKTAAIMENEFDRLAVEAAREGGKPLIDSKIEVTRAIEGVKLCAETMRNRGGDRIPMGINAASSHKVAFTTPEPIGVVVAVSAFNHPLNLIVHQVGPAVAAGCPVIIKPARKTPISCFSFVEILHRAGLPEKWCQAMVLSDTTLATRLATDSRVAFLSFIGSSRVGWMLRSKLSPC